MRSIPHQRGLACMALGTILALYAAAAFAEDPTVEQLQQEMKAMKAQLEQLQAEDEATGRADREAEQAEGGGAAGDDAVRRPPPRRRRRARSKLKQDVTENVMREIQPSLHGGEQDLPLAVQPGDRAHHRHGRLVPGARRRQLRVPLRRDRHLGRRSIRSRAATPSSTARTTGSRSRRRRSSPPRCRTTSRSRAAASSPTSAACRSSTTTTCRSSTGRSCSTSTSAASRRPTASS